MNAHQGDVALLHDPVAQELLHSTKVAHLSYVWSDGTPRVVPQWFHWNGAQIVLSSPPNAPKMQVLHDGTRVALAIDTDVWPYHVLMVRGYVEVQLVEGIPDEYVAAAQRYFGVEQGNMWIATMRQFATSSERIIVHPEWAAILDFEHRFPSAIADAMTVAVPDD